MRTPEDDGLQSALDAARRQVFHEVYGALAPEDPLARHPEPLTDAVLHALLDVCQQGLPAQRDRRAREANRCRESMTLEEAAFRDAAAVAVVPVALALLDLRAAIRTADVRTTSKAFADAWDTLRALSGAAVPAEQTVRSNPRLPTAGEGALAELPPGAWVTEDAGAFGHVVRRTPTGRLRVVIHGTMSADGPVRSTTRRERLFRPDKLRRMTPTERAEAELPVHAPWASSWEPRYGVLHRPCDRCGRREARGVAVLAPAHTMPHVTLCTLCVSQLADETARALPSEEGAHV